MNDSWGSFDKKLIVWGAFFAVFFGLLGGFLFGLAAGFAILLW